MKKKWLLPCVTLFIVLFCIEAISYLAYYLYFGRLFSYQHSVEKRAFIKQSTESRVIESGGAVTDPFAAVVPHPYLGYVYANPGESIRELANNLQPFSLNACEINSQGLLSVGAQAPLNLTSNTAIVVVTGGSVANQLTCTEGWRLISELQKLPSFKGKDVNIVGAALGAWRQPQQLLAISYLLTLGVKPALVINIDGFNESSNVYVYPHMYPVYPFFWGRLTESFDFYRGQFIARIDLYRSINRFLAALSDYFSFSVTAGTFFELANNIIDNKITKINQLLLDSTPNSLAVMGPRFGENDPGQFSVSVWKNASLEMAKLAANNGFFYVHFLQPTPTLAGSKPLSAQEQGYSVASHVLIGVPKNYPLLKEDGDLLKKSGVHFHDLSLIFKDVKETVYVDSCCHLNHLGNHILFENILTAVNRDLNANN